MDAVKHDFPFGVLPDLVDLALNTVFSRNISAAESAAAEA